MSSNNPRGFVEHRHLGNSLTPATRRYRVKADGASGTFAKSAGDPCVLVSGNTIARLAVSATPVSAPGGPVLGIIRAVYNSDGRPFTHNLPGTPNRIPASTAGFVDVNIDPLQTYLVSTDGTVTSTHIGQFVEATVDSAGTAAGRSGFIIELGTGSNTADTTRPFQIINIGANNLDGIIGGEANQDVEVILANPAFGNSNKVR